MFSILFFIIVFTIIMLSHRLYILIQTRFENFMDSFPTECSRRDTRVLFNGGILSFYRQFSVSFIISESQSFKYFQLSMLCSLVGQFSSVPYT